MAPRSSRRLKSVKETKKRELPTSKSLPGEPASKKAFLNHLKKPSLNSLSNILVNDTFPLAKLPWSEEWSQVDTKCAQQHFPCGELEQYLSLVNAVYHRPYRKVQEFVPEALPLAVLKSFLRKPSIFETWAPYEIAVFESGMCIHGKEFHLIQKQLKTKSVKEIIAFYYMWKKTSHYQLWKKAFAKLQESLEAE
eukprot:TRINITY_DN774178_c0_g1_i1.p1 TRINITY_DN774178_c0_g1~~TRINITY_DN774178_c0_g1_i1.p1  ORF type:complete len:194 (-),score=31.44 TRINITY_DN774178_c0_g1_i1:897-1478(-)